MNLNRPAPNDPEVMREFLRTLRTPDYLLIEVLTITWEGAHTPISTWKPGVTRPATTPENKVQQAQQRLLNTRRWFKVCQECGERQPNGWMHDSKMCQGCAEKHGVVF